MTQRLRLLFLAVLCFVGSNVALAQTLRIQPTDSTVHLDGLLTESVWRRAMVAREFTQNFPNDTARAYNDTEVRITYDHHHLYVAVVCHDRNPNKPYIVSSLRRDWPWDFNDNFSLYIDPFGDRINGFAFNMSPYGVEREGQLFNGEEVATEWDNKWRSATKRFPGRWQFEMAIPFKSIRYRKGATWFLMNFARHDLKNNQRTTWKRVPVAYSLSSLAFADTVRFAASLPDPGANISIIPYVAGRMTDDRREGGTQDYVGAAGFDAKIGLSPSLNLDLTVNPDFSQVEADQQVTNLNRFEIFFPERRQFFIENQDLFSQFGFEFSRPFFSRRIGISQDTSTGIIVQNPILYGTRLSGKIGRDWRVGLLNTQTARQPSRGIVGQNYTVGVVQRQVFGRSNVTFLYAGREGGRGEDAASRFTRIAGAEFNLQTDDNRWAGKAFFHRAFLPTPDEEKYTHGATLSYTSRNLTLNWLHEYVGRGYQVNDLGYVPRIGYWKFAPSAQGTFYVPGERSVISHGPVLETLLMRNLTGGRLTDREIYAGYNVAFRSTAEASVGYYNIFTYLFFPFDPTNSGGLELPTSTGYQVRGYFWSLSTDRRRLLSFEGEGWGGGYFNGRNTSVTALARYRVQPYGSFSLAAEYNNVQMPAPYNSAQFVLLGPRLDVTFTRSLFLTTFMQFNNQTRNVNLNARFQWRYAPVSDLFVVYTENYVPGSFLSKNRALVLKLSYWLNL